MSDSHLLRIFRRASWSRLSPEARCLYLAIHSLIDERGGLSCRLSACEIAERAGFDSVSGISDIPEKLLRVEDDLFSLPEAQAPAAVPMSEILGRLSAQSPGLAVAQLAAAKRPQAKAETAALAPDAIERLCAYLVRRWVSPRGEEVALPLTRDPWASSKPTTDEIAALLAPPILAFAGHWPKSLPANVAERLAEQKIESLIDKIQSSPALCGRNASGRALSLEWIVCSKEESPGGICAKILAGAFDYLDAAETRRSAV